MQNKERLNNMNCLRQAGLPLRQIGILHDISGESVRLILEKEYGTTEITGLITRRTLAKLIGCSEKWLKDLEARAVLHPIRVGGRYLYRTASLEFIRQLVQRKCSDCGKTVISPQRKYCIECRRKRRRNPYRYFSLSSQKK